MNLLATQVAGSLKKRAHLSTVNTMRSMWMTAPYPSGDLTSDSRSDDRLFNRAALRYREDAGQRSRPRVFISMPGERQMWDEGYHTHENHQPHSRKDRHCLTIRGDNAPARVQDRLFKIFERKRRQDE